MFRTSSPTPLAAALFATALSAAPVARAQSPTQPPRADGRLFTLANAIEAARRNIPAVMTAVGQARAAEGQVMLARTAMQPFVSAAITGTGTASNSNQLNGSTSSTCTTMTVGGPCAPTSGPFASFFLDASISARWTLYDFGRTALNVQAARRNVQSLDANVHAVERTAIASAATAYFVVLADQELVSTAQETLRQRQRELEISRGRVNAGVDPAINLTRSEIAAATAQLDLSTAQATVLNDTATLASTLGLDPAHPPTVIRPAEVNFDDDPQRAADEAAAQRPEVVAASLSVSAYESQVAAQRAAWRPALGATGAVGARFTTTSIGSDTLLETGTVSLALAVPIYDPTIPANVRIAEGNLTVARANLAAQVLNVRTDATQAAITVRAARQQLDEAQQAAQLAAANLALSEGRYQAGATTILELVDAEAQDATARLAVVQRRFQFEAAKVRLLASINHLEQLTRIQ